MAGRSKGSKGPGHGGPAKGAGKASPPKSLTKPGPGRGHLSIRGMAKAERIERWREALDEIAIASTNDNARVSALNSLLDRDEGRPVARQEISGPNGAPIPTSVRICFVRPGDACSDSGA